MQSITSKGNDIKEAIEMGLTLMNLAKQDVDIEIIQVESRGFLRKKPAIVKLINRANGNSADSNNEPLTKVENNSNLEEFIDEFSFEDGRQVLSRINELEGKAWVENGEIQIKDSINRYPTVQIDSKIDLYKNGIKVTGNSTVITESDDLELDFEEDEIKETIWNVYLSKDELKATLQVTPGYKIHRKLMDQEPSTNLDLILVEEKVPLNTLEVSDIIKKMDSLGINFGIDQQSIYRATSVLEPDEIIIAKGVPAINGKHGEIEYRVEVNAKNGLEEDSFGRVNFRESKTIPSVEKGEILAVVHPPKPGEIGVTVKNESIHPNEVYPLSIVTGRGIVEVDDKIVATESGRPSFEQRGSRVKVSIIPKLVHRGNVNLASGNVRFSGDVEVFGEVEENMLIDADGDIYIHKSVSYANLITLNSIVVKGNVYASDLAAGKSNMLIVELGQLLGGMAKEIRRMINFIEQLSSSSAFKSSDYSERGLQPLIKILLEKKFDSFVHDVKKYQEKVIRGKKYLEREWINVAYDLKSFFLNLSNEIITIERIEVLLLEMKELSQLSELPVEPNAFITISEVNNSLLYCSGNINIIGKGSVNTKIHSGGHLNIRGVLRGGEVYGHLGATINEVGSESGAKTIISVPEDQSIRINKAFEGTILKIGKTKQVLYQSYEKLYAKVDSSGNMLLIEG